MKTSHTPAAVNAPAARHARERGERGAALIMALLLTTLLLAAGGALILTSSMAATTAADSTAEMQAYYAAEAGLEAALAVVRRNVASNTTPALPATFRNVVCGTANTNCTNTGGTFSQWLSYQGGTVPLGNLSYSLTVHDASVAAGAAIPNSPYTPRFLRITSTGRGPKGARKVLEMTVDSYPFDFTARAAIAIRSNTDDNTGMSAFSLGSSNPHEWTGNDLAGQAGPLPAFTVTNTADYDAGDGFGAPPGNAQGKGEAAINHDNENVSGRSVLDKVNPSDLESWLKDATQARAFITAMRAKAAGTGRLKLTNDGDYGTEANPKFTFVDGNASGDGAGLMIVTGTWSQGGSTKFHGIVLALGDGNFDRNGNPDTIGAVVVANFEHNWNAGSASYTGSGQFGSPRITTAGGGNSTVGYHSEWVRKAMDTLGSRVSGIVEK
ncbi:MAG: PilX N-terminal domain-containing pilus assembly protein [Pyrinomonadaceae bacterium]